MKINQYHNQKLSEDYIDVYYRQETDEIKDLLQYVNSKSVLYGKTDKGHRRIMPQEIYYIESVDKKTFLYLEKDVVQIEHSLQELESQLESSGIVRINKSVLVNIYHIEKVNADINMHLCLVMENAEKLSVNRTYKKSFMKYLKETERRSVHDGK
ncbi:MAG: LytTR family transcriptional regulator [Herbinix sp.]|jgi:DNA-binding LytR/AlgR family response regulator|nr:LytTR family transcriptional regulator [Herbinix sp.]